ncbi:transposase [Streptomyces sp. NPDC005813]|uniref:transposase n=1 Tax=Streptomyces sp. NPDC005813 TaxID=3155592 RepID=UPI003400142B
MVHAGTPVGNGALIPQPVQIGHSLQRDRSRGCPPGCGAGTYKPRFHLAGLPRPDRAGPPPARRPRRRGLGLNLNVHRSRALRQWAARQGWLTIIQLPTCAPDLNPFEGIWSVLRRSATVIVVFADRDDLVRAVRSGMRRIQRRPHLIDGCLTGTGLSLTPTSAAATTHRKGQ